MVTRKQKTPAIAAPPAAPYEPSDYERGVLDTLGLLKAEMNDLRDAERLVDRLTYDHPTAQRFMGGVNHVNHIIDGVRIKVESKAMQMVQDKRRIP